MICGILRVTMLMLALIALAGCSEHESPEQQIRAMINRAESVLEARALLDAGSLISEAYQDEGKRTKQALMRLLSGYFLRNQSIHLLVQIERIDLNDLQRPRVTLYAAMAGKPFSDIDALFALRAALYRFDMELIFEEDAWRVVSGRWQPATKEDFLGMGR